MTAKQAAVKKYVVTLSADERERLTALIQTGKRPARQVLKARILLKAGASDAGEGWSDSQIAEALDTSVDTVARTRQEFVEGGIDGCRRLFAPSREVPYDSRRTQERPFKEVMLGFFLVGD